MEAVSNKITSFSQANQGQKWYPIDIKIPDGMEARVGHSLINISTRNMFYMIGGGNYVGETNEIYEIHYSSALSSDTNGSDSDGPSDEQAGDPIDPQKSQELACIELSELGLDFTGRYEFMAALDKTKTKIWIFGGANMISAKNDVCYIDLVSQKIVRLSDPDTDTETENDVPCGRTQGNNSCLIDLQGEDYLVIFGGGDQVENSVADGNLYLYKLSNDSWTKVEVSGSIPRPVQGHGMVNIGTKVYIYGGMDKSDYFGDLYMIDLEPETKSWVKIEPIGIKPSARAAFGVCLVGTDIYVCGGVGKYEIAFSDLWKFNTESMEWTLIDNGANGFEPRLDMAITCITLDKNDKYLLIHGGIEPVTGELAKIHNDFWVYPISKP